MIDDIILFYKEKYKDNTIVDLSISIGNNVISIFKVYDNGVPISCFVHDSIKCRYLYWKVRGKGDEAFYNTRDEAFFKFYINHC